MVRKAWADLTLKEKQLKRLESIRDFNPSIEIVEDYFREIRYDTKREYAPIIHPDLRDMYYKPELNNIFHVSKKKHHDIIFFNKERDIWLRFNSSNFQYFMYYIKRYSGEYQGWQETRFTFLHGFYKTTKVNYVDLGKVVVINK